MKQKLLIDYEEYIEGFRKLITSLGLKNTSQREYVLQVLFENKKHLSAEDIQLAIKKKDASVISMASIYKILKLFEELHVVKSIALDGFDGKLYELDICLHHDHMVCTICGDITEFYSSELEETQEEIAKEHSFHLQNHTMIMYGYCKSCYCVDNNS